MNSLDVGNALLYGIPITLSPGMYGGLDCLLARRNQPVDPAPHGAARRPSLVSLSADSAIHIVVAKSRDQLEAAADLVRGRYAWRGYEFPDGDVATSEAQRRSSQEITFLAATGRRAIGTLTLGLDGSAGLLAEGSYGEVIAEFRAAGHRVCELTRLALAESIDSKAVLAALFSLAHAAGRTLDDVTHVFIEVNPRHVAFYLRVLGFVVASGEKFCERVRARSVLLQLEIESFEERLMALGGEAVVKPLIAEAA